MLPRMISRSTEISCSHGDRLLLFESSSSMRRERTLRRMAWRKNGLRGVGVSSLVLDSDVISFVFVASSWMEEEKGDSISLSPGRALVLVVFRKLAIGSYYDIIMHSDCIFF